MAWTVVPCLEDLRRQLNTAFPDRDRTSDGGVGDTSHAASKSSHNPDKTGNPEHADKDSADEVRARDFDKDLNHPTVTMTDVVDHLVDGARAGRFWWLRYVIWQGAIWHKNTAWQPRAYTGPNRHDHHAHVNSDFTQAADTIAGVDYHLEELTDMAVNDDDAKKIARFVWQHLEPDPTDPDQETGKKPPTLRTGGWLRYEKLRADNRQKNIVAAVTAAAGADQQRDTALAATLQALPGAVAAELADEDGVDGAVVQAAVERALGRLRLTTAPAPE